MNAHSPAWTAASYFDEGTPGMPLEQMRDEALLLDRAIREEVALVPYDEQWPALFATEQERLLRLFPRQLLQVEHFGSTAVPGIPAKPIIDILAGVPSMGVAESLVQPLLGSGYITSPEFNATLKDRRWFMRAAEGRRTHHLHLVVLGGAQWHERLRFRDLLRSNAELAQRYANLKSELASQHKQDREAYTNAKSEFVSSVVAGA